MRYATVLIALSLGAAMGASAQQTPTGPAQTQPSSDRAQTTGQSTTKSDQANAGQSEKTGQASAGKSGQQGASTRAFASVDKDKNGSISLAEMQQLDAKFSQANFSSADTTHDKMLSQAEYSAWQKAQTAPSGRSGETQTNTGSDAGKGATSDGGRPGAGGSPSGNTAGGNTASTPPN
jgi:hypothetical protein